MLHPIDPVRLYFVICLKVFLNFLFDFIVDSLGFFFVFLKILFIYLWLCWVFVSVQGLSLVAASGGHSSSRCAGLSLPRSLLLRSTGSRRAGSAIVAHGPSRPVACGIFPDQGSNPCPLHWQVDSQPLRHQGSPTHWFFNSMLLSLHVTIFPSFLFLWFIYSFMLLWSQKMLEIISILLNSLRLVLCPSMWFILQNIPCVLEKNVYSFLDVMS